MAEKKTMVNCPWSIEYTTSVRLFGVADDREVSHVRVVVLWSPPWYRHAPSNREVGLWVAHILFSLYVLAQVLIRTVRPTIRNSAVGRVPLVREYRRVVAQLG